MKNSRNFKTLSKVSAILAVAIWGFSCAKQPSGVRTVKQSQAMILNPQQTTSANQRATYEGTNYQIKSIERPESTEDGSVTVVAEIQTPNGQYLPVTTTHHPQKALAYGTINMGTQTLDIRAQCYSANCAKYVLIVTVLMSNNSVHQSYAISNINEDFFHLGSVNHSQGANSFYQTPDAVLRANPYK